MNEVGKELKRLRLKKGWTQAQLAVYAESSQPTVNQIESGVRNPSTRTLEKLAGVLEVEVGDLFPKAQAPLPLSDVWRRGGEEAQKILREEGPFFTDFEALGRVQAASWNEDLRKWEQEIPEGQIPTAFVFGQIAQWLLDLLESRRSFELIAVNNGSEPRDELKDTLRMIREVEQRAVEKIRRVFEPVKTRVDFRKIWEENNMDEIVDAVESY